MKTQNTITDDQITDAGHYAEMIPQVRALCAHLDCQPDELSRERHDHYGMPVFSYGRAEYAIGSDSEADSAWDQSLDSYVEECITPEIEKLELGNLSAYIKFDTEMWKRDARMDGRGHSLSSYDGEENEEGEFFIYRTN